MSGAVLLAALVGCAGGGDDASGGSGDAPAAAASEDVDGGGAQTAAGGSGAAGSDASVPAGTPIAADRDIIATGTLAVTVDDADEAAVRAKSVADDAGGYVASSEADGGTTSVVRMSLRIPTSSFDDAMEDLAALGEVGVREVATDDVTDQVVDLQGRLENARTSTARLRELLAEAQDVSHVIAIEDRLTQREGEIELLAGQLGAISDQVDLSTIQVTIDEPAPEVAPEVSDDLPGFVEALRAGAATLGTIGLGVLAVAGFVLPFVPLALLGWFVVRWLRRRNALGGDGERPVAS